jgi:hypothetical protein
MIADSNKATLSQGTPLGTAGVGNSHDSLQGNGLAAEPLGGIPRAYPLLLTEEELIEVLCIREVCGEADPRNVILNLKREHHLPCIHICKKPLYPSEAVRQWVLDKVQRERR